MCGYLAKVSRIEPTAWRRGSTRDAPAARVATVPAPKGIPP